MIEDIINHHIQPLLTDQEFFKGLSICSKSHVLLELRKSKMRKLIQSYLNDLIHDSLPFQDGYMKYLLQEIQNELRTNTNTNMNLYQYSTKDDILCLVVKLLENIIKKTSLNFNMHSFNFHNFEKSKAYAHAHCDNNVVDSFECICDLIYFKYNKTDLTNEHAIKSMTINPTYRIPPRYMKIIRNNFYQAYALIY